MHTPARLTLIANALLLTSCATLGLAPSKTTGYAPVNGIQMYYEVHGKADGRTPLVLMHGGGSTIDTSFGDLLPKLAAHRQVIAFEAAGHGHTADRDAPFTFRQTADDAVALLEYLNIPQADFMGYSNGGHVALELAVRHPSAVRKLVLESAFYSRDGADPAFWEGFKGAKLDTMPPELREAYLKTAPHPDQLQSFFDKSVERMASFKGWTRDEMKSIRAPALVLCGDRDVVRPEHCVEMYRLLPRAQLAILPDTDHMKIVQRADSIAPIVEQFLDAP